MNGRRIAGAVLALLLLATACSGDDSDAGPTPPAEDTTTTALVDYSGVALGDVRGTTTTSAPVATGSATILGTVTGPNGPVAGATVRLERLVGGTTTVSDVATGPDGRYSLRNVAGGRYRVRSFLVPSLAVVDPVVQFVAAQGEQVVDLEMTDQRGLRTRAAVAPETPLVDEDVNLAVVIVSRAVDVDGVVRGVPVSGVRVELAGLGAWGLRSSGGGFTVPGRVTTTTFAVSGGSAFTDGRGQADFQLRCLQPGPPGLSIRLAVSVTPATVPGEAPAAPVQQVESIPLQLPDCVDPFAVVVDPNVTSTTVAP